LLNKLSNEKTYFSTKLEKYWPKYLIDMDPAAGIPHKSGTPLTKQDLIAFVEDNAMRSAIRDKEGLDWVQDIAAQLSLEFVNCRQKAEFYNKMKKLVSFADDSLLSKEGCLNYACLLFFADLINYLIVDFKFPPEWSESAIQKYPDEMILKFLHANVKSYSIETDEDKQCTEKLILNSLNKDPETVIDAVNRQFQVYISILERDSNILNRYYKELHDGLFPSVSKKKFLNTLKSLCHARLARLYTATSLGNKHNKELKKANKYFKENSLVIIQSAFLAIQEGRSIHETQQYFKTAFDLAQIQYDVIPELKKYIIYDASLGLAYTYNLQGRYDDAENYYRYAMSSSTDKLTKSIAFLNRGRNRLDNGDLSGAIVDLSMAINLFEKLEFKKQESDAHTNLGLVYLKQGLDEKAQSEFSKAIELNPTSPYPYYNLGVLFNEDQNKARAKKLFKTAADLDTTFHEARDALKKIEKSGITGIGDDWSDWWFGKNTSNSKKISGIAIIIAIIGLVAKAYYDIFFGSSPKINESIYALIAINIVLLLLPILSKLKLGPVELEVASKGEPQPMDIQTAGVGIAFTREIGLSKDMDAAESRGRIDLLFLNFILY
jgi:tetratricopeptide (TPR) repeat protein